MKTEENADLDVVAGLDVVAETVANFEKEEGSSSSCEFLTRDAFEFWTTKQEEDGCRPYWPIGFCNGSTLEAFANRKAGGLGRFLRPADKAFADIVFDGLAPEEVLGDYYEIALKKMDEQRDLKGILMVAHKTLGLKENVMKVFESVGVTEEDVQDRLLCEPLTLDELLQVVHPDGEPETCAFVGCGCKFQPVVGHRISESGYHDPDKRFDVSQHIARFPNGNPITIGSFVVIEENKGEKESVLLCGNPLFWGKGDGFPQDDVKSHLGQFRKAAADEKIAQVHPRTGMAYCVSRENAKNQVALSKPRQAEKVSALGMLGRKSVQSKRARLEGGGGGGGKITIPKKQ